jgi:protein tyrosine/serine phosphatase
MIRNFTYALVSSVVLVFALAGTGFSQTAPSKNFPNIKISNFGQMDERFYRGAQPKKGDYAALKALGINTVIDLESDPTGYEKDAVESLGMKYVNIPIVDKSYPTEENVAQFLKTVDDPTTGVFYAHCAGGRHRTGDMGALYRFTKYGWGFDQVFKEMENYDFYTAHGHQKAKDFVVDYAAKYEAMKKAAPANTAAANTATTK